MAERVCGLRRPHPITVRIAACVHESRFEAWHRPEHCPEMRPWHLQTIGGQPDMLEEVFLELLVYPRNFLDDALQSRIGTPECVRYPRDPPADEQDLEVFELLENALRDHADHV